MSRYPDNYTPKGRIGMEVINWSPHPATNHLPRPTPHLRQYQILTFVSVAFGRSRLHYRTLVHLNTSS
jgi:hypothetical protein